MELEDLIDAVLDETSDNELVISFKREGHEVVATIKDRLSDIGYARDGNTRAVLNEVKSQMQSFVDEQMARR